MSNNDVVRVFIGSGESSLIERKVLIYSLKKNSNRNLDIYVFNGTHNSIEHNDDPPILAPMSLHVKYKNVTEFSLYRFLIPEVCGGQGRAIFLDSDMVCIGDIGELFDQSMDGADFLAKRNAYRQRQQDLWGLSVMLIDCDKSRFNLETYVEDINSSRYNYSDLTNMSPEFMKCHPFNISELNPRWNEFDHYDVDTKLIHYTNLYTQPWKYPYHAFGDLWFKYFYEAVKDGFITEKDINIATVRFSVRRNIRKGNSLIVRAPFMKSMTRLGQRVRAALQGEAGRKFKQLKGIISS